MNEPLFLRREPRNRTGHIELDTRDSFGNGFPLLLKNERNNGREDVYDAIEKEWKVWGLYKYDLSANDFIQSLKLIISKKDN